MHDEVLCWTIAFVLCIYKKVSICIRTCKRILSEIQSIRYSLIHTDMHMCMYVCVCKYIYIYIYILYYKSRSASTPSSDRWSKRNTHVCVCVYVYVYTHIRIRERTNTKVRQMVKEEEDMMARSKDHIFTSIYTHTHMYTNAYTHQSGSAPTPSSGRWSKKKRT
jgi:hypothetical protein